MHVPGSVKKAQVSLILPAKISDEFKGERKMRYGLAALGFRLGLGGEVLGRYFLPAFVSQPGSRTSEYLFVSSKCHWTLVSAGSNQSVNQNPSSLVCSWDPSATPALRIVSRNSAFPNDSKRWSTRDWCCSEPTDFYRHLKKAVNTSVIAAIHEWKQSLHVLVRNWKW